MIKRKKGIEKWDCGCILDHDKEIIDPCKEHILAVLAKIAQDHSGRIDFAKSRDNIGGAELS